MHGTNSSSIALGALASAIEEPAPPASGDVDDSCVIFDPDRDLVDRAAAGDRNAFEALLRRHYDRIHRVAWRLTGSRVDAEDIAQDVCCALVGKIAMEDVSRAFEKGETDGFMKVLVDAETKEILGASFLGTSGDEAIHCVLDTMYAKAPYTVMQRAVHIHPTVSEFIPTMVGDLVPLQ